MMSGWRPIETAPKGKTCLFFLDWAEDIKPLNPPIEKSPWGDERYFLGMMGLWSSLFRATHWQPLEPPHDQAPEVNREPS